MGKTYQPLVIKRADETIDLLSSINFFGDNKITSTKYIRTRLCDILTGKFIDGDLTENDPIFNESEFNELIKETIVHSVLEGLEKKGFVGSYEDDDVEETFYMTDFGKQQMVKIGEIKE